RFSGGEERLVRTLGQQVVRKIELMEDVAGRGAGLNLHVTDLAGAGDNNRQFLHKSDFSLYLGGRSSPGFSWTRSDSGMSRSKKRPRRFLVSKAAQGINPAQVQHR